MDRKVAKILNTGPKPKAATAKALAKILGDAADSFAKVMPVERGYIPIHIAGKPFVYVGKNDLVWTDWQGKPAEILDQASKLLAKKPKVTKSEHKGYYDIQYRGDDPWIIAARLQPDHPDIPESAKKYAGENFDPALDGHAVVLMEAHYVSDAILEIGPLTEKSKVAVSAVYILSKLKNQKLYRKIVGGEGYPTKKGLSGLSDDERREFKKQLQDAAKRAVAEGEMDANEAKQAVAHIEQILGRVYTKSLGKHYLSQREDVNEVFEELVDVNDLFEAMSEGYAKAGDDPEYQEIEATFDKLMTDQDLSKEEQVDVDRYLRTVVHSARGALSSEPAQLSNPTVTAGPQTEGLSARRASQKVQKQQWMKSYLKVAKQYGAKSNKIDWDAAHHYYFQGLGPNEAFRKTHVKDQDRL
jgi:hypothetical protein